MRGPPLVVFPDLISGNLERAGGGIVSSLCHDLCLPEGGSTLSRLMPAGRYPNPWRIAGMPPTLRPKFHSDQLGFS